VTETEQTDDERGRRLILGQEARRLLEAPLIKGFFADHYAVCYKAFCDLPMDSSLENYRVVHHNFLAAKALWDSLQLHITRAEADTIEMKQEAKVSEDIEV